MMAQVQIRFVGQSRAAVEAALMRFQPVGIQVQRGPRRGRKNEWLAYASIAVSAGTAPQSHDT